MKIKIDHNTLMALPVIITTVMVGLLIYSNIELYKAHMEFREALRSHNEALSNLQYNTHDYPTKLRDRNRHHLYPDPPRWYLEPSR